ncbi:hypothetical protein, partial [Candidatus Binatus sp.]|uniref:hypothetical protein n=1 Tax=Candidatus Binatus sp. TaxID=2811406 RepID=UPI003C318CFF
PSCGELLISPESVIRHTQVRTHLSLDKDAPDFRPTQKIGRIAAIPIPWWAASSICPGLGFE